MGLFGDTFATFTGGVLIFLTKQELGYFHELAGLADNCQR